MTDGVVNEQGSYPPLVAAALKPSDVAELQKHVSPSIARAREQIREVDQGQSPREQPSASIRTMWDSVVSWMKTAVDYIAFENPEDVAMATSVMAPHGKVRCDGIALTGHSCTRLYFSACLIQSSIYINISPLSLILSLFQCFLASPTVFILSSLTHILSLTEAFTNR